MKQINCIAVDDEPLALDIIEDYAAKIPYLQLSAVFDNPIEAINYLKTNQVDLIFLDIQMDDLTGVQMLKVIEKKPEVIFTTAYEQYALQGYELNVADYLLKPISFERFLKAVEKVYKKIDMPKPDCPEQSDKEQFTSDFMFVKTEFRMQKINFADILYIEGQGDYLRIITTKEKIMTLQNFKKMEDVLPRGKFIRIHKSYMVAINKIDSIERNRIKIGETHISISETYRKNFYDLLEERRLI